jgi:hypothetical protein
MRIEEIKRGTYWAKAVRLEDADGNLLTAYNGKSIRCTVKELTDDLTDDSEALIEKDLTITNGMVLLEFTTTDTDLPYKQYICDFRIMTDTGKPMNSEAFYIKIVTKVTNE